MLVSKWVWWAVGGAPVLMGGVAVFVWSRPHGLDQGQIAEPPDLLKQARFVTDVTDWQTVTLYIAEYEWVSATEVIYYKREPSQEGFYHVIKFDTSTGRSER